MTVSRLKPSTQFAELFTAAEARAIDPVRVARLLLERLRGGERCEGLRQLYDTEKESWGRRDTHWRPVPRDAWEMLEDIAPDGTSYWADDAEEPDRWANLDWFAGSLRWSDWDFNPSLEFTMEDFAALRIKGRLAEQILATAAGHQVPKVGAPGRIEERPLIEAGVRLVAEGKKPEEAAAMVATETEGRALMLQLRRLARNIKAATKV